MSEKQHTPEEWEKSWEEINGHIPNGVNPHAYKWGFIAGHKYGLSQSPDLLAKVQDLETKLYTETNLVEVYKTQAKYAQAKVEELERENNIYHDANSELDKEYETLCFEKSELTAKVEEQGKDIEELAKQNNFRIGRIHELREQLSEQSQRIQTLKDGIKSMAIQNNEIVKIDPPELKLKQNPTSFE